MLKAIIYAIKKYIRNKHTGIVKLTMHFNQGGIRNAVITEDKKLKPDS
jgi:hypothetical protein